MKTLLKFSALTTTALFLVSCSQAQTPVEPVDVSTEQLLAPEATTLFLALDDIEWTDSRVSALITELETLEAHGLNPAHYHIEALKTATGEARAKLASDAWLSAAAHMIYGKVDAVSVEPDWTAIGRKADLPALLAEVILSGNIENSLQTLAPNTPQYQALRNELEKVLAIEESPFDPLVNKDLLRPGMSGEAVKALQQRLWLKGLILEENVTGKYDEATQAAIKEIQSENGLDADGAAGAATIRAINRDNKAKTDALRVNLERLKWLPDDLGQRHLRVNIAGFSVTANENGNVVRSHSVIVGKNYRKTPVFSDQVEYIVFNPWWETPASLAVRDKLPSFRKDPSAVDRLGFEIRDRDNQIIESSTIDWNSVSASNFPYRIRQRPGDVNALGQVKIMFPNPHNVYLHDTPNRELFSKRQRAFSSGCIRTHLPLELSEWLLKDTQGWDDAKIDAAVKSKRETRATLAKPVPVHVLYQTVVADEFGVRYLDDLYERDQRVLTALDLAPQ